MTSNERPLTDTQIEGAILRRIGGHADVSLTRSIVQAAAATSQERARPSIGSGRLRLGAMLAAAAIVAIGVGVVATGSPSKPAPSPAPLATLPAVVSQPTGSPAAASPSGTPATCATDTVDVSTGNAMPPAQSTPADVPAGVLETGVYLTRGVDAIQTDVWAASAGETTRIASIVDPEINIIKVNDVSADGRRALIQVGVVHGGLPGPMCDDLYLVRTDGAGATRLTRNGPDQHAVEGSFSPDGRYVAYRYSEDYGPAPLVGVIELDGDLTPQRVLCDISSNELHPRWAPSGDRLAVVCGGTVILAAIDPSRPNRLGHVTSSFFPTDGSAQGDLEFIDARWLDDTHLLVVNAQSGTLSNGPVLLRTLSFDTPSVLANATWSKPVTVVPWLADSGLGMSIAVAPDGHAFTVLADPAPNDPPGDQLALYLVEPGSGRAEKMAPWPVLDAGWTADSRALVYVDDPHDTPVLTVRDPSRLDAHATVPLPPAYQSGIWRGSAIGQP